MKYRILYYVLSHLGLINVFWFPSLLVLCLDFCSHDVRLVVILVGITYHKHCRINH